MTKYKLEFKANKEDKELILFTIEDDDIFSADERGKKIAEKNGWIYVGITTI